MAGHNKWSKVKRLKAVTDARKGKVFSRLARDITLAAKAGGGKPAAACAEGAAPPAGGKGTDRRPAPIPHKPGATASANGGW